MLDVMSLDQIFVSVAKSYVRTLTAHTLSDDTQGALGADE